nr:hypothetical protein [Bacteroidota bacterium]
MKPKDKSEDHKKVNEEIEEKIDRLQKQNEAESIALKKLLHGLNKMGKANIKKSETKKNK